MSATTLEGTWFMWAVLGLLILNRPGILGNRCLAQAANFDPALLGEACGGRFLGLKKVGS